MPNKIFSDFNQYRLRERDRNCPDFVDIFSFSNAPFGTMELFVVPTFRSGKVTWSKDRDYRIIAMSPKSSTVFACQNCGAQSPKWLGRCPECSQWNTYLEEKVAAEIVSTRSPVLSSDNSKPFALNDISAESSEHAPIGIGELDRVLGGGIVDRKSVV